MIEIIAVIFSLISVWLTTRNNILCWPTGIIGIIFYFLIFYQDRNWSNVTLQLVFILQSIIGWVNWKHSTKTNITELSSKNNINSINITFLLIIFFFTVNNIFKGNLSLIDSTTTSLSIMGMVLLSYRKIESWIFWMIADVFYIFMFIESGRYLSSFIYLIFFIMAFFGYRSWKQKIQKSIQ